VRWSNAGRYRSLRPQASAHRATSHRYHQEMDMGTRNNVYGEGNYEATRDYNDATKRFVNSAASAPRTGRRSRARPSRSRSRIPRSRIRCPRTLPATLGHATSPSHTPFEGNVMLRYAAVFFIIAVIAAVFGFGGIAAGAVEIAKILFFIFLVLFVVSLVAGLLRRGT
jgi:uncharacterized membrane protein YtjA (UPF0391 family)